MKRLFAFVASAAIILMLAVSALASDSKQPITQLPIEEGISNEKTISICAPFELHDDTSSLSQEEYMTIYNIAKKEANEIESVCQTYLRVTKAMARSSEYSSAFWWIKIPVMIKQFYTANLNPNISES